LLPNPDWQLRNCRILPVDLLPLVRLQEAEMVLPPSF
jgi:hypothetical protein